MRNSLIRETNGSALNSLRAVLPERWSVELMDVEPNLGGGLRPDAVVRVMSPSGNGASFAAETKRVARDGSSLTGLLAIRTLAKEAGLAGFIVLAPYLPAAVRTQFDKADICYADSTGWVRLVSECPMLAITSQGADRAPHADNRRQILSLKGVSANRIIQVLLMLDPPIGVRTLADAAKVSPGTVSKILPLLAAEDAIDRDRTGRITAVNRRLVLGRWTLDYRVLVSNPGVRYYVAPRGIDKTQTVLATRQDTAFTGPQAAGAYLPAGIALLVPPTQIVCYTKNTATAADVGLLEVDAPSANVILVTSQDKALLDKPGRFGGMPVAPLPLVLADLLTLPGRYPQQAEALMDALAKTDSAWRP